MRSFDKEELRKRVWLNLFTHPLTLIPFLGGVTLLLSIWALGAKAGSLLFAGLAGMAIGAGQFFTRLFARGESIRKDILMNMQQEAEQARQAELDALEQGLEEDHDERSEQSLRELRALLEAFKQEDLWSKDMDTKSAFDIVSGVNQLFETCVDYLKKTLQLWRTAQRMASEEVKAPILERRETLIAEVRDSTRHISEILAKAQTVGLGDTRESDLRHIRNELDTSLKVAQRVRDRIAGWQMTDLNLQE